MPYKFVWFYCNPYPQEIATTYVPTLSVTQAGRYMVHVYNQNGCSELNNTGKGVGFMPYLEPPKISGNKIICENELTRLSAIKDPKREYQWYQDGDILNSWSANHLFEEALDPGNYEIGLKIRIRISPNQYCVSEMSTYTVSVIPPPADPIVSLSVKSCRPYEVVAEIANPEYGAIYRWNNGSMGDSVTYYHDGPIGVTAYINDCTSSWEGDLPVDLNKLLWIFPKGCYVDCIKKDDDISIIGPLGSFSEWIWINKSGELLTGSNSAVEPLTTLPEDSAYHIVIANEYCLSKEGEMQLRKIKCEKCDFHTEIVKIHEIKDTYCNYEVELGIYNPNSYDLSLNIYDPNNLLLFLNSNFTIHPGLNYISLFVDTIGSQLNGNILINFKYSSLDKICIDELFFDIYSCSQERINNPSQFTDGHNQLHNLKLAPNPANRQTTAFYEFANDEGYKSIVIVDMLGRIIKKMGLSEIKGNEIIDLSKLSTGNYIVLLKQNNYIVAREKLILK